MATVELSILAEELLAEVELLQLEDASLLFEPLLPLLPVDDPRADDVESPPSAPEDDPARADPPASRAAVSVAPATHTPGRRRVVAKTGADAARRKRSGVLRMGGAASLAPRDDGAWGRFELPPTLQPGVTSDTLAPRDDALASTESPRSRGDGRPHHTERVPRHVKRVARCAERPPRRARVSPNFTEDARHVDRSRLGTCRRTRASLSDARSGIGGERLDAPGVSRRSSGITGRTLRLPRVSARGRILWAGHAGRCSGCPTSGRHPA